MRAPMFLGSAFAAALLGPVSSPAQSSTSDADPKALLGIEVSLSGTPRDTLGLLVSSIAAGSPAERAGLHERDRISEINGLSVRVSPEDVGSTNAQALVRRRLARELGALRPGDAVSMRVYASGRFRTITVRVDEPEPPAPPPARVTRDAETAPTTVLEVIGALKETQTQLHQVVASERAGPVRDSLEQVELELADLQRRLEAISVQRRRQLSRRGTSDEGAMETRSLQGLRVTVVTEELEPYFGDGSARGLLVLEADETWAPIRTGDVIVRVDGRTATPDALREAYDSSRGTEVEILRRRRSLIVTLGDRR